MYVIAPYSYNKKYVGLHLNIHRLLSSGCSGIIGQWYKNPDTEFHKVYKKNMDENSCIATRNIIPTIVKNDKTAGLIAEADGRISQEYLKCQVRYY